MSAYPASQATYDYIASGLYDAAIRHTSDAYDTVRTFLELADDATGETLEHHIDTAVSKLYDLNRLALVTRYGDQWDRDDHFAPAIKRAANINLAQFIQCVACVLYQCSEYLTHETETYKQWRDLEYKLAYTYFAHSPEYQTTKWDLLRGTMWEEIYTVCETVFGARELTPGGVRILQTFNGYTVDFRLREFRKFPKQGLPEFIDFRSNAGAALVDEMYNAAVLNLQTPR